MLPLFPPSSLDNSILTSVLVGLLVVWAFHETLGWGLSGLVVPGYLASVFLIEPTTAIVVVFEALATWAVVGLVSERVPHWWPWTRLFGRDRFLLFLLVSVGVRLCLEAGGYAWLAEATGIRVLRGLHSLGGGVAVMTARAGRSGADPGAAAALAAGQEAQVTVFATTGWFERTRRGEGLARRAADPGRPTGAGGRDARGVAE